MMRRFNSELLAAALCAALLGGCGSDDNGPFLAIAPNSPSPTETPETPESTPLPPAETGPTDTVPFIQIGVPVTLPASGWWSADTRANGSVSLDDGFGAPLGFGLRSARLTTGPSTPPPSADKAQIFNFELAGFGLSSIDQISYWAYLSSASTGGPSINLSLNVSVTGSSVPTGFATLVYEPSDQSGGPAAFLLDSWQQWDATATTPGDGLWWTNRIANPNPGSQSNPQPWATFQQQFGDATILAYGFNLGSANPNMIVGGDGLVFGKIVTDF